MAFKSAGSRRAFFAGKAAEKKQGMGTSLTASPSLNLPKLSQPQVPDTAPELPAEPKFPTIRSLMKIPRIRKPKV